MASYIFKTSDDLDLDKIFGCGQCFRWNRREDGSYIGAARGCAAIVRAIDGGIEVISSTGGSRELWQDYFDLDTDYSSIRRAVANCEYMERAADFGRGIRLLHQDKWEALCSFIFSQCNNITRISGIVERFCSLYGKPIQLEDRVIYDFPDVTTVAGLTEEDMAPLRSGYRAPYVLAAAQEIVQGRLDLEKTALLPTDQALKTLRSLRGVGEKVANCVLLFGLNKRDAFPIDVWMKRALKENFPPDFDPAVFGANAGIAQQYIFYYARSGGDSHGKSEIR